MEWALNRLWLEQGEILSDWQFFRFPPCRQGKYFWNPVLSTAAVATCTRLFLGQKYRLSCVSRKLSFFRCGSRTLFFPMTYRARKPVTNLNAFQKSGEVFNDLWLHTTAPLLNNEVKSRDRNIIPNRTQAKNPSFELTVRISQDVLIVWVCLTCPEYDIQTSRTVRVSLFPFRHVNYFPSQNA